jgi:cytosine/adenosine deaminase-related metal-dependent hydrolase
MSTPLDRLKNLTNKISSYELTRKQNLMALRVLYRELRVDEKVAAFEDLFMFKAINLSGVSLLEESLGEIKKGKYMQILAISYDKDALKKSTNISLAYFGRAENVDEELKNKVVAFVLRYRFEKSFLTLEHYNGLLERVGK